MEYMRTLPDKAFQLAIVDPPYGLDRKSTQGAGKLKNRELNKADIAKRWDIAPSAEYFDEYEWIHAEPSQYDCTGQVFTSWRHIFPRNGRFYVYHCFGVDV